MDRLTDELRRLLLGMLVLTFSEEKKRTVGVLFDFISGVFFHCNSNFQVKIFAFACKGSAPKI